jgi:transcriptional regulator with XRE-family HTH domain
VAGDVAGAFPSRLRRAMARRGMTQVQLAAASGLTAPCVSRYLSGSRVPKLGNVGRIRDALGCAWEELLG